MEIDLETLRAELSAAMFEPWTNEDRERRIKAIAASYAKQLDVASPDAVQDFLVIWNDTLADIVEEHFRNIH